jgi:hypothetical protein
MEIPSEMRSCSGSLLQPITCLPQYFLTPADFGSKNSASNMAILPLKRRISHGRRQVAGLMSASVVTTAGNGNRTRMASLEGWNFTIKLCPRSFKLARSNAKAKRDLPAGIAERNIC